MKRENHIFLFKFSDYSVSICFLCPTWIKIWELCLLNYVLIYILHSVSTFGNSHNIYIQMVKMSKCMCTGNRQGHGHGLHGHRKKSVLTSKLKEKHKLESTLSQLTGWMIKRAAAECSEALSKRAVHCCHKSALTAEFTLTTAYSTC